MGDRVARRRSKPSLVHDPSQHPHAAHMTIPARHSLLIPRPLMALSRRFRSCTGTSVLPTATNRALYPRMGPRCRAGVLVPKGDGAGGMGKGGSGLKLLGLAMEPEGVLNTDPRGGGGLPIAGFKLPIVLHCACRCILHVTLNGSALVKLSCTSSPAVCVYIYVNDNQCQRPCSRSEPI